MPRIPVLNGPQVEAQTGQFAPIKDVAQPDSFGNGPALQNVVASAAKVYQVQKKNADDVAIMSADQKLSALQTQLLYDPKTGAMNRRGKDAFGAVQETGDSFTQGIDEIESTLSDNDQKAAFRKMAMQRQSEVSNSLNKHVSVESQKYDIEQTSALVKTEQDAVTKNPYDQDRVASSLFRQQQSIAALGQRMGMPPEKIAEGISEAQTATHAAVINTMLAQGNDLKAKEYYDANVDQIVGKPKEHLTKDLEAGSVRGESQRKAAEFFGDGTDLKSALDQAREITDPKVQDATVQKIKELNQQKDMVDRDRKEQLNIRMANEIDKGGDPRGKPGWAELSTSEKMQIDNYYKHRQAGTQPTTDWRKWTDLRSMGPNQLAKIDPWDYRNSLDDTKYNELLGMVAGVRNGDKKTQELLNGFQTDDQIVKETAINKLSMNPKSDDYANFNRMVNDQVVKLQQDTGKKASTSDVQQIVDNLTIKVVTGGMLWGTTEKPLYQLKAGDKFGGVTTLKDIPSSERRDIEKALKNMKKMDTDENILELYNQKLNKMRGQ